MKTERKVSRNIVFLSEAMVWSRSMPSCHCLCGNRTGYGAKYYCIRVKSNLYFSTFPQKRQKRLKLFGDCGIIHRAKMVRIFLSILY